MKLLDQMMAGGSSPAPAHAPMVRIRGRGVRRLPVQHWVADATALEHTLLAHVDGPVLDLGCGPGRLVAALAERGIAALGVDASSAAVARSAVRSPMRSEPCLRRR